MENRPFLSNPEPSSRSAPLPESEPVRDVWTPQPDYDPPQRQFYAVEPPKKSDPFSIFKENSIGLILLGIVIGVIIMNMRPIIVNPGKS